MLNQVAIIPEGYALVPIEMPPLMNYAIRNTVEAWVNGKNDEADIYFDIINFALANKDTK